MQVIFFSYFSLSCFVLQWDMGAQNIRVVHLGSGVVWALLLCTVLDTLTCFCWKPWTRSGFTTGKQEALMPLSRCNRKIKHQRYKEQMWFNAKFIMLYVGWQKTKSMHSFVFFSPPNQWIWLSSLQENIFFSENKGWNWKSNFGYFLQSTFSETKIPIFN